MRTEAGAAFLAPQVAWKAAIRVIVCVLCACSIDTAAGLAQEESSVDPSDFVDRALPFPDGFRQDNVARQRASLFGIRPAFTLRSWEEHSWGLRLRLAIQFAGLDFQSPDGVDLESVSLGAVVPGIGFVFPTGQRSLVRPFIDLGVGSSTGLDDPAIIAAGGVQTEFVFPAGRFELGLEPKLEYTRAFVIDASDSDVGSLSVYTDARHPLWFSLGEHTPQLGAWVKASYLFSPLDFKSLDGESNPVEAEFTIGALFTFDRPPKLWFLEVPMIGFGWAFGDLEGIRIRIGGDRLMHLPAEPR
jgi:hypothetical protein